MKTQTFFETSQVPLLSPADYSGIIKDAGFEVETFAGYEEEEARPDSRIACHVGVKPV